MSDHEHALIAACFRYNDVLERVLSEFQHGDFVDPLVNQVFQAMSVIHDRGQAVDLVGLASEMDLGQKERGRAPILTVVSEWMELPALPELNLDGYVKAVRDGRMRKRIEHVAVGIVELSHHEDVDHAIDKAQDLVLSLSSTRTLGGVSSFGEMDAELDGAPVIPTGFTNLDDHIGGGLRRSEMTIIGARTAVGKTSLGLNVAANVANRGGRVLIFSLEMSEEALVERLISAECGVPKFAFSKGLHDESVRKLYYGLPQVWRLPIMVDVTAALSVQEIKSRARRASAKQQLDLIVVDYAQLIAPSEKNESRARQVAGVMEALRASAKELRVPIVVMSQINRAGDDQGSEPELLNLSESSGIENTADLVVLMWRKTTEVKEAIASGERIPTSVAIKKNRHGDLAWFRLWFQGPTTRFYENP